MPTFAIRAIDKPDSLELRARTRPVHLEHLAAFAPQIVAAGALLDEDGSNPIGSLLIVEMPSLSKVEEFVAADPYAMVRLFQQVEIRPIRVVYPAPQQVPAIEGIE